MTDHYSARAGLSQLPDDGSICYGFQNLFMGMCIYDVHTVGHRLSEIQTCQLTKRQVCAATPIKHH